MLNSGWLHQEDSPISRELVPSANSDDSGHLPEEDPEDTSAQGPALLSLGIPHQDTNHVPNWPGLQTLLQQLPPQDSDERYCLALGEDELAELRLFCVQRKQKALGQGVAHLVTPQLEGHTCEKCREQLKPGEYSVFAAPAGEPCCWHRPCFTCQACGQALVNLIYFYHDGHLYCGRHHAELLRPRCPACDQLIFSRRCTEAEGRRWHENHFCCQGCAGPLRGGHYALPGGSPYCPSCFESRYSDAGLSLAGTLEGRASLGKGRVGADQCGREWWLGLGRGGGSPGRDPRPSSTPSHSSSSAPVLPPQPPDPSFGARSSHRASLAGALQGPPEPTLRRGRGCGAGLAPGRGTRPPAGERSRERRGPLGRTRGGGCAHGPGRGRRLRPTSLASVGEGSPDPTERKDHVSLNAVFTSRAEFPAATSSSSLETQSGRELERLETPRDPKEDASCPCPTCSSSSDSEPEGFFLGQRLPRLRKTLGSFQAEDSDTSRKHCTIC
ncbi:Hypothetical predicted protein [Marmota monax]|uniref:LIM zinc-binding domain-containing protein n=1 Tax=Marmota monax TaxID=9995 RepID=A0A5E4A859_MARMO|nr:Hypothetical predicted protein [Marmota monax]